MNYDQHITELVNGLKEDINIPQPYRNYMISDAKRLQIAIRGAKSMSGQAPPPDAPPADKAVCTCPTGGVRTTCPVHGDPVA